MNKKFHFEIEDEYFLTWSIPNYFIQKYKTKQFHKNCVGICEGTLLVKHLIQYLSEWSNIFRGNWVTKFQVTYKHIKNKSTQLNQFQRFLDSFNLDQDLLLFIEFIVKFYCLLNVDYSTNEKRLKFETIPSVYFKYRLCLSLKSEEDVGQPSLVIHFLKYHIKSLYKFSQNSTVFHNQTAKFIEDVAVACDFYQLYSKIREENPTDVIQPRLEMPLKGNEFKQVNKMEQASPQPKNDCNSEQEFYGTPKSKQSYVNQKALWKNRNRTTVKQSNVVRIIEKKNKEKLQCIHKMAAVPRFSNFKGKFKKKESEKQISPQYSKIERFIDNRNDEPKMEKPGTKGQLKSDDIEGYDFLCDRSF